MPQARTATVIALAILLPSCLGADDPSDDPPEVAESLRCSTAFCGGNSPEVDAYLVHELNLDGKVSPYEKWTYLGMSQDGVAYDLQVSGSQLYATGRGKALTGYDLIGARLYIQHGVRQYAIVIDTVVVGGTTEVVPPYTPLDVYGLSWARVNANLLVAPIQSTYEGAMPDLDPDQYAVCSEPPQYSREAWDESSWMPPWGALIFEGDRISAPKLTVGHGPDDRWFNIGCAAHTLNKLRLTRSTIHFAKDWYQEQATLKMLAADYCGDGTPYTVAGEPLVWRNHEGFGFWRYPTTVPTSLEARWSPAGALCIGSPRLEYTTNPAAQAQFPNIWSSIYSNPNCASLPSCSNWNPFDDESWNELVTSANYDY